MRILVENGSWNNMGEGWYRFSLYYLLKTLYPNDDVIIGEGIITRDFKLGDRFKRCAFSLFDFEYADLHVFSGPVLPKQFLLYYAPKIKQIFARGGSYALISISGTRMCSQEIQEIGSFLREYPPVFMSTRDTETYNTFNSYVDPIYDGVCTALLVSKTVPLSDLSYSFKRPFFISSYYTSPHPVYSLSDPNGEVCLDNLVIKNRKYLISFKYYRHIEFLFSHQAELNGVDIVHTMQDFNHLFKHVNFAYPNSFLRQSQFVVSDRVHACAIGLSYGKPVRFTFETSRAGIFTRLGLDYKSNYGKMILDPQIIDDEYGNLVDQIKKYIG